jgi:REP element-mobilizing transposase RayT
MDTLQARAQREPAFRRALLPRVVTGDCDEQGNDYYAGSINREHVHMLIGIPPQLSVSRAVQYIPDTPR